LESSALPDPTGEPRPEYRYHLLRVAAERFKCDLSTLDAAQTAEAHRQARRTFELESLVLSAPEAQGVVIAPDRMEAAIAEVRGRYPDAESFASDLARNDLDPEILEHALRRELIFDAVMQQVGARRADLTELEERLFYETHQDRFASPERRAARHLLITVNEDFPENRREVARARIERVAGRLRESRGGPRGGQTQRFGALARKHSECPTALEDGRLGEAIRGQLYPELDELLFRLQAGQMGGPVESELGFHLVYCERIRPARTLPFSKVREQIRALLEERRARDCQKAWIAQLRERVAG
jgi:peptidyl-prolyl cis-trans isomerase C